MAIYEYKSVNGGCKQCSDVFEVVQRMSDPPLQVCDKCGNPVERIPSLCSMNMGFREANQYPDVKYHKYWRDRNGVRHKVTPADGDHKSPTVSRRVTASPEQIAARKKRDYEQSRRDLARRCRQKKN